MTLGYLWTEGLADIFSSFTSSVGFRDKTLTVTNDRGGQIHTDTSPKQEVNPACFTLLPVSICVAVQIRCPDQLVSIALVQDDRNGLLTAY